MDSIVRTHGGNIRKAAETYGLAEDDFIDFSANINPLGPNEIVRTTILEGFNSIGHYPDPENYRLIQAISERYKLPTECIFPGNGAIDILYWLVNLIRPKTALLPVPTFSEYENAVVASGGKCIHMNLPEENHFLWNNHLVLDYLKSAQMIFLCNPNNPTGSLIEQSNIISLLEKAKENNIYVVVDESFMDFIPERHSYSVLNLVNTYDNLFVLHSLTKFFSIPGLRLGAGFANPILIQSLKSFCPPWSINSLAALVGTHLLGDSDFIDSSIKYSTSESSFLFKELSTIDGIKPLPPAANFIFINIYDTGLTASELTNQLAKKGILIRDCSSFPNLSKYYIRVAVKKHEENQVLIDALRNRNHSP